MSSRIPRIVVSVCLLRAREVLLIERANPPFAGMLSLPGGRVEFGETLAEAACREVGEETGLTIEMANFHCLHEAIGDEHHAVIAVHHAQLPTSAEPVPLDDAADVRFVAIDDLPRLEGEGQTTPGLADIVRSIARSGSSNPSGPKPHS